MGRKPLTEQQQLAWGDERGPLSFVKPMNEIFFFFGGGGAFIMGVYGRKLYVSLSELNERHYSSAYKLIF